MAKSLGNVVRPLAMKARYGMDAFRYYLLRDMAFGQDAEFSEAALVTRLNADLANGLGNLASRVLAMQQRYFGGALQPRARGPASGGGWAGRRGASRPSTSRGARRSRRATGPPRPSRSFRASTRCPSERRAGAGRLALPRRGAGVRRRPRGRAPARGGERRVDPRLRRRHGARADERARAGRAAG